MNYEAWVLIGAVLLYLALREIQKRQIKKAEEARKAEIFREEMLQYWADLQGIEGRQEGESLEDFKARISERLRVLFNRPGVTSVEKLFHLFGGVRLSGEIYSASRLEVGPAHLRYTVTAYGLTEEDRLRLLAEVDLYRPPGVRVDLVFREGRG